MHTLAGTSYQKALEEEDLLDFLNNEEGHLDPFHLDDPELKQSKDRTVTDCSESRIVGSVTVTACSGLELCTWALCRVGCTLRAREESEERP